MMPVFFYFLLFTIVYNKLPSKPPALLKLNVSMLQTSTRKMFVSIRKFKFKKKTTKIRNPAHCEKRVRIPSYSDPHFSWIFPQNNSEYGRFLRRGHYYHQFT